MNATPEEWRPIPGYEGQYEVSDQGGVRSLDRVAPHKSGFQRLRGVTLKQVPNELGYLSVGLSKEGVIRRWKIHQLVALAFIGLRPDGMDTCHTNDIRTDNRAANLRYDTHSENARDHVRAGNHYETKRTHCPRKHVLAEPNLRVAKWIAHGHRDCLACHRASGWLQKNPGQRDLFDRVADQRYQEIMSNKKDAA